MSSDRATVWQMLAAWALLICVVALFFGVLLAVEVWA